MGKSALFLDRDGVLLRVQAGEYNNTIKDAQLLPNVIAAVKILRPMFDYVIIVTNQASIGYGYSTFADLQEIHDWIYYVFSLHNVRIDHFMFCPHRKDEGCKCRKPGIELFERAMKTFDLDPACCVVVGDMLSDIQAAIAFHALPVAVLTGVATKDDLIPLKQEHAFIVEKSLYDFAIAWRELNGQKASSGEETPDSIPDVQTR